MKKVILLLGAVIFLSSIIPTWAATSCRGRNDCPSGYECVYLDESGVPRLDSTNSANNAFCARIYQGVTSVPTRIQPTQAQKYAKEGEFCGAGPGGVVQCEPGLKCDESRNRISENSSEDISGEKVGAGGICVKITPIAKPTKIDDCRLKVCGDADCNGVINSTDLVIWRKERDGLIDSRSADFDNNGKVDDVDYKMLKLGLEKKCEVPVPSTKYAKEGEFCGAGPGGVVQCEPGLKCDESRNRINENSSEDISGEKVGAGGICVKIDDCRLKVCGDANCDGKIDIKDRLVWFKERFGSSRSSDFNQDNRIDMKDYSIITSGIQNKCQPIVIPKLTLVPTRKPVITPVTKKFCETDSDCLRTETCYQPPMLTCTPGENCIQVMPQKYCRSKIETSPAPTDRSTPTLAPTQAPVTKKFCETDSDCLRTETCYQPPMPTCPAGENCTMALPLKYCKPVVVSEVTGVKEKIACNNSKGDANRDGKIGLADYAIWRYEYAKGLAAKADFNCDKVVDLTDYKIWKESFIQTKSLMVSDSN